MRRPGRFLAPAPSAIPASGGRSSAADGSLAPARPPGSRRGTRSGSPGSSDSAASSTTTTTPSALAAWLAEQPDRALLSYRDLAVEWAVPLTIAVARQELDRLGPSPTVWPVSWTACRCPGRKMAWATDGRCDAPLPRWRRGRRTEPTAVLQHQVRVERALQTIFRLP